VRLNSADVQYPRVRQKRCRICSDNGCYFFSETSVDFHWTTRRIDVPECSRAFTWLIAQVDFSTDDLCAAIFIASQCFSKYPSDRVSCQDAVTRDIWLLALTAQYKYNSLYRDPRFSAAQKTRLHREFSHRLVCRESVFTKSCARECLATRRDRLHISGT
jgi:hypothetical protein